MFENLKIFKNTKVHDVLEMRNFWGGRFFRSHRYQTNGSRVGYMRMCATNGGVRRKRWKPMKLYFHQSDLQYLVDSV